MFVMIWVSYCSEKCLIFDANSAHWTQRASWPILIVSVTFAFLWVGQIRLKQLTCLFFLKLGHPPVPFTCSPPTVQTIKCCKPCCSSCSPQRGAGGSWTLTVTLQWAKTESVIIRTREESLGSTVQVQIKSRRSVKLNAFYILLYSCVCCEKTGWDRS